MDHHLISKYLLGKATEEEVERIFQWIDASPENKRVFIQFKKAWAMGAKSDEDNQLAWRELESKLDNKPKPGFSGFMMYAAILVFLIGIGYFFTQQKSNSNLPSIDKNAITLELGNGNIQIITEDGESTIVDKKGKLVGIQKGNVLNYNSVTSDLDSSKPIYNELTIPYGKTFKLVLSDGTTIHLNAGSSIKYPVKFIEGTQREVFLKGEAFFDVIKNANHPFVVNVNDLNVRVLGTKFNVSSYPEDRNINTVLVEGSVALHDKDDTYNASTAFLLEPGYKGEWNPDSKETTMSKVDTNEYTSWIEGRMIFRNAPFKIIRKKLERKYNVSIKNNNKILEERTYNAVFDIESIEQVLRTLNEIYSIEYTIDKNEIIIN
ncbi:FecR protein [Arenibacter palladensis]|uniref:FecR protein n=1 Tax=Arenibacter palladensis TaxID=237373 RepID=A0A1M5CXY4_9FLAO|nr:FecR domain-containing protein [Arenibacter palladensis]SHF59545.1 FecR protein [Arenibacter palladensis]